MIDLLFKDEAPFVRVHYDGKKKQSYDDISPALIREITEEGNNMNSKDVPAGYSLSVDKDDIQGFIQEEKQTKSKETTSNHSTKTNKSITTYHPETTTLSLQPNQPVSSDNVRLLLEFARQSMEHGEKGNQAGTGIGGLLHESNSILSEALELYRQKKQESGGLTNKPVQLYKQIQEHNECASMIASMSTTKAGQVSSAKDEDEKIPSGQVLSGDAQEDGDCCESIVTEIALACKEKDISPMIGITLHALERKSDRKYSDISAASIGAVARDCNLDGSISTCPIASASKNKSVDQTTATQKEVKVQVKVLGIQVGKALTAITPGNLITPPYHSDKTSTSKGNKVATHKANCDVTKDPLPKCNASSQIQKKNKTDKKRGVGLLVSATAAHIHQHDVSGQTKTPVSTVIAGTTSNTRKLKVKVTVAGSRFYGPDLQAIVPACVESTRANEDESNDHQGEHSSGDRNKKHKSKKRGAGTSMVSSSVDGDPALHRYLKKARITAAGMAIGTTVAAAKKLCSHEGCTSMVHLKGGVCGRHGARVRKLCSREDCTSTAQKKGGVCWRHGAKKLCSHEGCTLTAQLKGGMCKRHGARKLCSHEGCTDVAQRNGGACLRHVNELQAIIPTDAYPTNVPRGCYAPKHRPENKKPQTDPVKMQQLSLQTPVDHVLGPIEHEKMKPFSFPDVLTKNADFVETLFSIPSESTPSHEVTDDSVVKVVDKSHSEQVEKEKNGPSVENDAVNESMMGQSSLSSTPKAGEAQIEHHENSLNGLDKLADACIVAAEQFVDAMDVPSTEATQLPNIAQGVACNLPGSQFHSNTMAANNAVYQATPNTFTQVEANNHNLYYSHSSAPAEANNLHFNYSVLQQLHFAQPQTWPYGQYPIHFNAPQPFNTHAQHYLLDQRTHAQPCATVPHFPQFYHTHAGLETRDPMQE